MGSVCSKEKDPDWMAHYLSRFDPDEIDLLKKIHKDLASRNDLGLIDKETFLQFFPLPGIWGVRLYQRFDFKVNGGVDLEEFLIGVAVCCRGTNDDKIHVLFELFDLNGDFFIDKAELTQMLSHLPSLWKAFTPPEPGDAYPISSKTTVPNFGASNINSVFNQANHSNISQNNHNNSLPLSGNNSQQQQQQVQSPLKVQKETMELNDSIIIPPVNMLSTPQDNRKHADSSINSLYKDNSDKNILTTKANTQHTANSSIKASLLTQAYAGLKPIRRTAREALFNKPKRITSANPHLQQQNAISHKVNVQQNVEATATDSAENNFNNQNFLNPKDSGAVPNKTSANPARHAVSPRHVFPLPSNVGQLSQILESSRHNKDNDRTIVTKHATSNFSPHNPNVNQDTSKFEPYTPSDISPESANGEWPSRCMPTASTHRRDTSSGVNHSDAEKDSRPTTQGFVMNSLRGGKVGEPGESANSGETVREEEDEEAESLPYVASQLEALIDQIIEECEFDSDGKLCYLEFKAWIEHNPVVLRMFRGAMRERSWALQGRALYPHSKSIHIASDTVKDGDEEDDLIGAVCWETPAKIRRLFLRDPNDDAAAIVKVGKEPRNDSNEHQELNNSNSYGFQGGDGNRSIGRLSASGSHHKNNNDNLNKFPHSSLNQSDSKNSNLKIISDVNFSATNKNDFKRNTHLSSSNNNSNRLNVCSQNQSRTSNKSYQQPTPFDQINKSSKGDIHNEYTDDDDGDGDQLKDSDIYSQFIEGLVIELPSTGYIAPSLSSSSSSSPVHALVSSQQKMTLDNGVDNKQPNYNAANDNGKALKNEVHSNAYHADIHEGVGNGDLNNRGTSIKSTPSRQEGTKRSFASNIIRSFSRMIGSNPVLRESNESGNGSYLSSNNDPVRSPAVLSSGGFGSEALSPPPETNTESFRTFTARNSNLAAQKNLHKDLMSSGRETTNLREFEQQECTRGDPFFSGNSNWPGTTAIVRTHGNVDTKHSHASAHAYMNYHHQGVGQQYLSFNHNANNMSNSNFNYGANPLIRNQPQQQSLSSVLNPTMTHFRNASASYTPSNKFNTINNNNIMNAQNGDDDDILGLGMPLRHSSDYTSNIQSWNVKTSNSNSLLDKNDSPSFHVYVSPPPANAPHVSPSINPSPSPSGTNPLTALVPVPPSNIGYSVLDNAWVKENLDTLLGNQRDALKAQLNAHLQSNDTLLPGEETAINNTFNLPLPPPANAPQPVNLLSPNSVLHMKSDNNFNNNNNHFVAASSSKGLQDDSYKANDLHYHPQAPNGVMVEQTQTISRMESSDRFYIPNTTSVGATNALRGVSLAPQNEFLCCPMCSGHLDVCPLCNRNGIVLNCAVPEVAGLPPEIEIQCVKCIGGKSKIFTCCWICGKSFLHALRLIPANESDFDGWLFKKGRRTGKLIKRFGILHGNLLYLYKPQDRNRPSAVLFLEGRFVDPVGPDVASFVARKRLQHDILIANRHHKLLAQQHQCALQRQQHQQQQLLANTVKTKDNGLKISDRAAHNGIENNNLNNSVDSSKDIPFTFKRDNNNNNNLKVSAKDQSKRIKNKNNGKAIITSYDEENHQNVDDDIIEPVPLSANSVDDADDDAIVDEFESIRAHSGQNPSNRWAWTRLRNRNKNNNANNNNDSASPNISNKNKSNFKKDSSLKGNSHENGVKMTIDHALTPPNANFHYKLDPGDASKDADDFLMRTVLLHPLNNDPKMKAELQRLKDRMDLYLAEAKKRKKNHEWGLVLRETSQQSSSGFRKVFFVKDQESRDQWIDAIRNGLRLQRLEHLYALGPVIGEGKFSVVRHAVSRRTQIEYAVKVIDKRKISEKEKELLWNEVAIIRLVKHQNVIYLHEILDTRTHLFMVLELVTGGELFSRGLQGSRVSEVVASKWFKQLLTTTLYLHSSGIVHRDLKPENILLTDSTLDAQIKIVDFGLSTLLSPGDVLTQPCGTLNYVAPEVVLREGYDARADIWSLGVILYFLLSGKLPFSFGHSGVFSLPNYLQVPFTAEIWSRISNPAKDLVKKLLTRNPNERISLKAALEHIWIMSPEALIVAPTDHSILLATPALFPQENFHAGGDAMPSSFMLDAPVSTSKKSGNRRFFHFDNNNRGE